MDTTTPQLLTSATIVGRNQELSVAIATAKQAILGRSQVLLISGEAGIGKTRLAEEIESRLADLGFHALWGTCSDVTGVPSYWPWIQILRQQLQTGNNIESTLTP